MYIILFAVCLSLLLKNKSPLKWPLLLSAIIMFALSTTSIIMTIYLCFGFLLPAKPMCRDLSHPLYIFYMINRYALLYRKKQKAHKNSVIADALMVRESYVLFNIALTHLSQISRCYAVWGNSQRVIAFPCLLLLASASSFPEFSHLSPSQRSLSIWTAFHRRSR